MPSFPNKIGDIGLNAKITSASRFMTNRANGELSIPGKNYRTLSLLLKFYELSKATVSSNVGSDMVSI